MQRNERQNIQKKAYMFNSCKKYSKTKTKLKKKGQCLTVTKIQWNETQNTQENERLQQRPISWLTVTKIHVSDIWFKSTNHYLKKYIYTAFHS